MKMNIKRKYIENLKKRQKKKYNINLIINRKREIYKQKKNYIYLKGIKQKITKKK